VSAGLGRKLAELLAESLAENEGLETHLKLFTQTSLIGDDEHRRADDELTRQLMSARAALGDTRAELERERQKFGRHALAADALAERQRRALDLIEAGIASGAPATTRVGELLRQVSAVLDPNAEYEPLPATGAEQRAEFLQALITDAISCAHGMNTEEPLSDPAARLARMVKILSNK
jgi:hypothetical protein